MGDRYQDINGLILKMYKTPPTEDKITEEDDSGKKVTRIE
jgi:hypothetical protein